MFYILTDSTSHEMWTRSVWQLLVLTNLPGCNHLVVHIVHHFPGLHNLLPSLVPKVSQPTMNDTLALLLRV